jgi:peptide chain release factor subunit 3
LKNKKQNNEYGEEEEDTYFGGKLVKPALKPSVKAQEIPFAILEKQKQKQQKNSEKQAEKKQRKEVSKIKKVSTQVADEQLVEVDETREPASMVFIGHVDSGKSTISGNLMFMMGVVD